MGTRNPESRSINVSVEVEVRGEIQGLYFLKYCKEEATKLGVFGWVKHGRNGTIVGIIQGQKSRVEQINNFYTYEEDTRVPYALKHILKIGENGVGMYSNVPWTEEKRIAWLSNRGSPGSRIENCYLYNYQYISKPEYRNFSARY